MQTKFAIPLLVAGLALGGAAAFAADQPPPGGPMGHHHWRMDNKDMAKHLKSMCENRYAHAVGTMAYLQTRLALKGDQKSAFENWKTVVLGSAKTRTDACVAMKPPAKRPSLVEMAQFRETMLEHRLADLKAQMPALQTLTASLDQKQEHILECAIGKMMREGHGHRGFGHGGMRDHGDRGGMHGHGPMPGPGPDGPSAPN